MQQIKKVFVELIEFLEANSKKNVGTILEEVRTLAAAKKGGGGGALNHHRDEQGNIIAARCAYYDQWFDPSNFGLKAGTTSGLNNMSTVGLKMHTRANTLLATTKNTLAAQFATDEISGEDFKVGYEAAKVAHATKDTENKPEGGFDTLEDFLA